MEVIKKTNIVYALLLLVAADCYAAQDPVHVFWKEYYIDLVAPPGYCYVSDETDRGEGILENRQRMVDEATDKSTKLLMFVTRCQQRRGGRRGYGEATVSKDQYFRRGSNLEKALSKKRAELSEVYGVEMKDRDLKQALKGVLEDMSIDLIVDDSIPNQSIPVGLINGKKRTLVSADLRYEVDDMGSPKILVIVNGYTLIKNAMVKFSINRKVNHRASGSIVNAFQSARDDVVAWVELSNRESTKHKFGY
ncbi:MAG: hypothetical protein HOL17_14170 [Gammaproteobacteria bacterium]|jgi:hypothetical protein|nr:hypothetical protein [Gammaproteobacteria bacterium]